MKATSKTKINGNAPVKCAFCRSTKTTLKGKRKNAIGTRQMYFCKKCGRRFSLSPLHKFTYPATAILNATILYNLGHSITETQRKIKKQFKISPNLPTVLKWIKDFGRFSALKSHRDKIKSFAKPDKLIKKKLLKHHQNYLFQYHG